MNIKISKTETKENAAIEKLKKIYAEIEKLKKIYKNNPESLERDIESTEKAINDPEYFQKYLSSISFEVLKENLEILKRIREEL